MDLFSSGDFIKDIKSFKKEYKKHLNIQDRVFNLAYGSATSTGGVLFVDQPYHGGKSFREPSDIKLQECIARYNIKNELIIYCHPKTGNISPNNIKDLSPWIQRLTNIILPKLIVLLGEEPVFCYLKKKILIRENHGKIIEYYNNIPLFLTFPMIYILNSKGFEDKEFKNTLLDRDWNTLKSYA